MHPQQLLIKGYNKMKNKLLTYLIYLTISILTFTACVKDDQEDFNPSDNSYKGKLHKIITYVAGDSTFYEFIYDANGKVTNIFAKCR